MHPAFCLALEFYAAKKVPLFFKAEPFFNIEKEN